MKRRFLSFLKNLSLMEWLGYAGLIPFFGSFISVLVGLESGLPMFLAYSALILSFMAGACWGVVQGAGSRERQKPEGEDESSGAAPVPRHPFSLLVSIGVFLVGMFAWWYVELMGTVVTLAVLGTGYLSLLLLEQGALYRHSYSSDYKRLRRHLSFTVIALHLALLLILLNGV